MTTATTTMPDGLRKAMVPLAIAALAAIGLWWLLSLDRVSDRVRNEEVEMIDISEPPPPPPPEEAIVEPEPTPLEAAPTEQAVQPDPLSPPQPSTVIPPAGELTSLMQSPTADSGAFSGGPRGQGGTGSGPLIGGTGSGSARASRAYAETVMRHIQRHLRRASDLEGKPFGFRVRVSVSPDGAVTIGTASRFDPPDLEQAIRSALRGLPPVGQRPPEGMPNFVVLNISQS